MLFASSQKLEEKNFLVNLMEGQLTKRFCFMMQTTSGENTCFSVALKFSVMQMNGVHFDGKNVPNEDP
jgi:hypothetical protein